LDGYVWQYLFVFHEVSDLTQRSNSMIKFVLTSTFILVTSICCSAQHCLVDKPTAQARLAELSDSVENIQVKKQLDAVIAAPITKARRSLHHIRKRYQSGLASSENLILTARIFDDNGVFEQVFAQVQEWTNDSITAIITSDLDTVREYRKGQAITFSEKHVLDWVILRADGSEEGNFVGKYLASLQQ